MSRGLGDVYKRQAAGYAQEKATGSADGASATYKGSGAQAGFGLVHKF